MKIAVRHYIRDCDICQRYKVENCHPTGFLQPLPILTQPWSDISMDFIEGPSQSHTKDVIMVIVDRLTKYAHFIALSHPYAPQTIAKFFKDNIFKLHGTPKTIVSNRDPIFISHF